MLTRYPLDMTPSPVATASVQGQSKQNLIPLQPRQCLCDRDKDEVQQTLQNGSSPQNWKDRLRNKDQYSAGRYKEITTRDGR